MKKEKIIDRLKNIYKEENYDYSLIEDSKTSSKVKVICPIHGVFEKRLDRLFSNQGCPKCSGKVRKTLEDFIHDAKKVHGDKYEYIGSYINAKTKIEIICPIHGSFMQTPTNHLSGNGCPKCKAEKLRKLFSSNINEFSEKGRIIHNNEYSYEYSEYINNSIPLAITCPKHGVFYQIPHNHLQGKGCPKCNESKLEKDVMQHLKEKDIEYIYQWHLPWNKRYSLDFYLPQYDIGIECQGIQHFEDGHFKNENLSEINKRDEYKYVSCKENGIDILYYSNIHESNCICDINELISQIKKIEETNVI